MPSRSACWAMPTSRAPWPKRCSETRHSPGAGPGAGITGGHSAAGPRRDRNSEEPSSAARNAGHAQSCRKREVLVGIRPQDERDSARKPPKLSRSLGAAAILFKGGHGAGATVARRACASLEEHWWRLNRARQDTAHTHGTGCALATAIACGLALGRALEDAVRAAHAFRAERDPDRARSGTRSRTAQSLERLLPVVAGDDVRVAILVHHRGAAFRRGHHDGFVFGAATRCQTQSRKKDQD